MAHRLQPPDGKSYLEPEEVVLRLRDEFAVCEVDVDRGRDAVGDMLAKLLELKAPQAIIDRIVAGQARALHVTIADSEATDDYLDFLVSPNDGILVGYFSAQHESAVRPLLERCAKALDYTSKLV